jgi:hypothetical protein
VTPEKARTISNWALGGALFASMCCDIYSYLAMRKRERLWCEAVVSDAEKMKAPDGAGTVSD